MSLTSPFKNIEERTRMLPVEADSRHKEKRDEGNKPQYELIYQTWLKGEKLVIDCLENGEHNKVTAG